MSLFTRRVLDNGLRVLVHEDPSTEIVAVNVMYDVGAADENPNRTGFAHLFEHLMFGGSINIPNYDEPLQRVGAENNAFTSNDITNYYVTLPKQNIETAFWLESDRMLELDFSQHSLDVQKNVVVEEFNQRYINQPYGDAWLKLRPLAYKVHPYQWATIGKETAHISEAVLDEVRAFYFKHYAPANAVLTVGGDVDPEAVFKLAEKWFGTIPNRQKYVRSLPVEPPQNEARRLEISADVPADAIYIAWKMPPRSAPNYYATDLLSDILGRGDSSRLYGALVMQKQVFSNISAFITGERDAGLIVISGKPANGVTAEEAEAAVWNVIEVFHSEGVSDRELQKSKNKVESTLVFNETSVLNKVMNLSFHEVLWGAEQAGKEAEKYTSVTAQQVNEAAKLLRQESSSTLIYRAKS